ncbi:glycerol kinase GlpK [Brevibacterium litoralis]|uniref:glycerol kinase GlpK n=1 Tax=Brevibacterium litoralis TaxID=3138935 RepID=UPI0032ED0592
MGHVLALDEGTTSTRAVIHSPDGQVLASHAQEFRQIFPRAGWVEHDAAEIFRTTREVIGRALGSAQLTASDLSAIGITNQRETTVVWDRHTGRPLSNALVWQDTRGGEYVDRLRDAGHAEEIARITGLPINTYFSAIKTMWLMDHVEGLQDALAAGDALLGTVDSWLIWNFTGGPRGGRHVTDVTNASRTMLMDLTTLDWSDRMLDLTGVPREALPEILPSVGEFGTMAPGFLAAGVPITGVLGDQQAATFGQACFSPGDTKNTYGTGCFILMNTGEEIHRSEHGLVTTLGFQIAGQPAHYALEGSIAVAGSLVQWLRDNLGIIRSSSEVEALASSVEDCGDVYFVPAFSGLYAPRWRPDARGTITGLTRFATKGHIARAALESTAFQTAEVLDVLRADSGFEIDRLRADGGMSMNDLLMQFQADVLDIDVVRPTSIESTAGGAASAAGIGSGLWSGTEEVAEFWQEEARWSPGIDSDTRSRIRTRWDHAVERSLGWVD